MSKKSRRKGKPIPVVGARHGQCISVLGITIPLPIELGRTDASNLLVQLNEALARYLRTVAAKSVPQQYSDEWLAVAAKIASSAWRAERRLIDPESKEPREESKLLHRDVAAVRRALTEMGVETIDQTGQAYDSGMALKVITFEPTAGLTREEITETIKPTVRWQGQLLQAGEVIVGTPEHSSERGKEGT